MINCKDIAAEYKRAIKEKVYAMVYKPTLAVIQVGNDAASNSYISGKKADCEEVGIIMRHYRFNETVDDRALMCLIDMLNKEDEVDGIIVQLPLPKHLDKDGILNSIADEKDVDGFKHNSTFVPCTPMGVMNILDAIHVDVNGKVCCVIGRGEVGKPMVDLLTKNNATVIWCNSHTQNDVMQNLINSSDIVITATGKAGLIKEVPDDIVVIDVGITRGYDNKLCGDVDKNIYSDTALITPVPGGVGLMTRIALLENVVHAAERVLTKQN